MPPLNVTVDTIIVVGDIFADISAKMDQVLTESEAIDRIQTEECPKKQTILSIGQGVDQRMIESAIMRRARRDAVFADRFVIRGIDAMPRAVKRLAHKEKTANILTSFAEKIDDSNYRLDLHFASSNEFFGDHMTGMHIQGMALTEAARQAFLVVTEEFFLAEENEDFYFVIKSLDSRYINFVFPLGATIDYRIVKHSKKAKYQSFEVDMTLMQAGQICAEFSVAFTAFESHRISERETEVFHERLKQVVKQVEDAGPPIVALETEPTKELAAEI